MTTKRVGARRSKEKEAAWRALIAEWRASGQALSEFAANRGIKYWTVRGWVTELKRRDAERAVEPAETVSAPESAGPPAPSFVPVRVVDSESRALLRPERPRRQALTRVSGGRRDGGEVTALPPGAVELIPFGQVRIRLPPDFDPGALRALLDVLEAPC